MIDALVRRDHLLYDTDVLFIYRWLGLLLLPILLLPLALLSSKIRLGLKQRLKSPEWPEWLGQQPTVWFHCASGEFEYAKPVIRAWRRSHPRDRIVVSYFSPTYQSAIAATPEVDFSFPLPLDLPGPTATYLKRIKPKWVAIARTDLWPEFLWQCRRANIPRILFAATRSEVTPWQKWLLPVWRWRFELLSEILAVSTEDADTFQGLRLKVPVRVLGDPRFDQVFARLENSKSLKEYARPQRRPILVAGSTWPEDEAALLEAASPFVQSGELGLVIVPHEVSSSHIEGLMRELRRFGLSGFRYSKLKEGDGASLAPQVLVVDQVGILAELYQWADLALVGGSFRSSVHSVMEPLACGALTVVGPKHRNNREAMQMQLNKVWDHQDTSVVSAVPDSMGLNHWLRENVIVSRPEELERRSEQIKLIVRKHRGASERISHHLQNFTPER